MFKKARSAAACCRRLAEALDGGVTSLSAKYAVEALHQLALSLPTSRDLILATGAVPKLILQLQQGCQAAHYTYVKVFLSRLLPVCCCHAYTAGAQGWAHC